MRGVASDRRKLGGKVVTESRFAYEMMNIKRTSDKLAHTCVTLDTHLLGMAWVRGDLCSGMCKGWEGVAETNCVNLR